ncbi:hypothetical protein M2322_002834 [Rhodoblastus acidophilus]|uniref:hypothetical protein n=1 Tax=Rhodoblastus acidophilus TaxID=1074 RepID=UPI0022247CCD|nr:hypothetical protein [Rhodoblastus acidophilus]MCW2317275.1 hypothetical protein [Rhodoblastus acidophilus]
MTEPAPHVKGILDGIAQLLIGNSDLAGELKVPLAGLNAALAQTQATADAAAVAVTKWRHAVAAFEAVLTKYGVHT